MISLQGHRNQEKYFCQIISRYFRRPLLIFLTLRRLLGIYSLFLAKISFFSRVHFLKIPLKTFFLQFDYFNDINREFFRHPPSRIFRTVSASPGGRGVGWALEAQVRFCSDFSQVANKEQSQIKTFFNLRRRKTDRKWPKCMNLETRPLSLFWAIVLRVKWAFFFQF